MMARQPDWTVLLIGGPSGVGKSTIAARLGRRLGITWLQVDDLRLALQASRVILPEGTAALYFFDETPDLWSRPPERLCQGLIAVGEALAPAIAKVVDNHVHIAAPVVIEGDGILPALLTRPELREHVAAGQVRAVFVVEPDEQEIFTNMQARGRGLEGRAEDELRTQARANWLYGQWLAGEARAQALPVAAPRPWMTLVTRVAAASGVRLPT